MGVAIGSLVKEYGKNINLDDFKNKKIGFDAYNMLYQFVTTIRGSDGLPLSNNKGEVTSHINGLFYRVTNFLKSGINPIFVFDGVSCSLKDNTKEDRRKKRSEAKEKYELAIEKNDIYNINKYGRQSATINEKIIQDSKELLEALGVSYFVAPSEAEAQISVMTKNNLLDYSASQDYDCFLFGSPNLLRNLNSSGKKKLPYRNIYVDNFPNIIYSEDIFKNLNITREKLIWLSILIGTDFNNKIEGVGPKTALKLVKEYNSFEEIQKYLESKNKVFDFDFLEIEDIFKNPNVDLNIKYNDFEYNRSKLESILIDKCNFQEERTKSYLNDFEKIRNNITKQQSISKWF